MNFYVFFYSLDVAKNIGEMNFFIANDLKYHNCWLGYNPIFEQPYWFGLSSNGLEAYEFKSASELVNAKVFNNKSLKDIWNVIEIVSIDGICLKDWFLYCSDWFLKYEYRFGSSSNLDLGYDIVFYSKSFSITKIHLMEDFSAKYYTLDKSKLDSLKLFLKHFDCPQSLSSIGICDGYSSYIEIKQDYQIKRFGGYNPQNEDYLNLERLIQSIVGDFIEKDIS